MKLCTLSASWQQSTIYNNCVKRFKSIYVPHVKILVIVNTALNVCPSAVPVLLCSKFPTGGAPRNVDFFRPPSSAPESVPSDAFDLNWKLIKAKFWWLNKHSVFKKLSLGVEFQQGTG